MVSVKKGVADNRDTCVYESTPNTTPELAALDDDMFQYRDLSTVQEDPKKYLHLLSVDPDNVLTEEEKTIFHRLHQEFAHVFSPQPGRYNGRWGYIDNRLQFATPPPPNLRTHVPNYSPTRKLGRPGSA